MTSYEQFSKELNEFHGPGHLRIGIDCALVRGRRGTMFHTETSARDPIFYRWHSFLENIMQDYRDTHFPQ